ncbi:MAG TPA: ArsC family reductase [Magnetovibrio sp.]
MLTVYGIKNCDTVKKALKWLDAEHIAYDFHDLRVDGLAEDAVQRWVEALGWESVLNRRSTTWRELSDSDKEMVGETTAVALLIRFPVLVKRPVFDGNGLIINGFSESVRAKLKEITA